QFYTDEFAEELTLQDAGQYYFEITDADERSKRSDSFTIEEEDFEVTNWTRSAIIYDIDYSPTLFVFTEGGTEPFTYYWFKLEEDGKSGYWVGGNSNSLPVSVPGIYECNVQDREGRWACSEEIPVTYTNSRPVIINQPVSHTDATRFDSGAFDCALYCRAVKANGNNSDLKYIWEMAYPVEGGWAQTTTTGQWFYPIEPGFYRCRVVDTVTGNYIYSNTAAVCEELVCEVHTTDKKETSGVAKMYFDVWGGIEPYKVELYLQYTSSVDGKIHYYLSDTYTGSDLKKPQYVPRNVRFTVEGEESSILWQWEDDPYYAVAYDALGYTYLTNAIIW
ncbi:MAG: hypothetical protein IKY06_01065, partial [Clostridia bacterium]|nr:hypothetical protein [Clostridia bacterium]